jgi:hypothetical protein
VCGFGPFGPKVLVRVIHEHGILEADEKNSKNHETHKIKKHAVNRFNFNHTLHIVCDTFYYCVSVFISEASSLPSPGRRVFPVQTPPPMMIAAQLTFRAQQQQ